MSNEISEKNYKTTMDIALKATTFTEAKIKSKKDNYNSIIIVLAVASLIVNVIRLWMVWKDKKDLPQQIKNPSFINRFILRREVGKLFSKDEKQIIYESILEVSKTLSEQEINDLIEEVEKNK
jgi:hypothetical protein